MQEIINFCEILPFILAIHPNNSSAGHSRGVEGHASAAFLLIDHNPIHIANNVILWENVMPLLPQIGVYFMSWTPSPPPAQFEVELSDLVDMPAPSSSKPVTENLSFGVSKY
eukprot:scaffold79918_cov16-Prasinocladus_malaysianus.AAC.1